VAEPGRKNLALEQLTGPQEVGLLVPDAEVEADEQAEVDLLEPDGLTFAKLRVEAERATPSAPSEGRGRAH
jgi:hypothetical protein